MKAFNNIGKYDKTFCALVRFVSERLGYTDRKTHSIRSYSPKEIAEVLESNGILVDDRLILSCSAYSVQRKDLINNYVRKNLMCAVEAEECFFEVEKEFSDRFKGRKPQCSFPYNKQKGDKKKLAYLTCIVNLLAEMTLLELGKSTIGKLGFVDDPRHLATYTNADGVLIFTSSRRFDGAYPSLDNSELLWEIKEYYYTTTFGSRISDGIYESLLDGYEFNELFETFGVKPYHIMFIDAKYTWWDCGKSYLCRIVDMLNFGLIDEVIVGREVLTRWPELIKELA